MMFLAIYLVGMIAAVAAAVYFNKKFKWVTKKSFDTSSDFSEDFGPYALLIAGIVFWPIALAVISVILGVKYFLTHCIPD